MGTKVQKNPISTNEIGEKNMLSGEKSLEGFDFEKIPNIAPTEKDCMIGIIADYGDTINEALFSRPGLDEWFDIYIISPEFKELERIKQKQMLELYRDFRYVLVTIDEFLKENRLGVYNHYAEEKKRIRIDENR